MSSDNIVNAKKFQLAICERFQINIHGADEQSTSNITEHFLINTTMELSEFYDNSYKEEELRIQRYWRRSPLLYNQKFIRLEIIQADQLKPGGEYVAYLNTFWLRIVQRCWKKVFKARKELLLKRSSIKALQERQRTGQWPAGLRDYPAFKLNLLI
jgi:hypothetical protein